MCPFSHQLKQTVKERERKMKRNDSKKVDRLVHPLCQHLLVYIVSLQPCFSWVEKSGVQHQQKLHSTELLLLHIADSSIGAGRCQSVCLLFYHSLFPTPDTHTHTTPSTPQINLPPCLHNCPFSDCSALCLCECVSLRACVCHRATNSWHCRKCFFFLFPKNNSSRPCTHEDKLSPS